LCSLIFFRSFIYYFFFKTYIGYVLQFTFSFSSNISLYHLLFTLTYIFIFFSYQNGPRDFTPTELARYNGSDAALPIYVAVNGSVFDVSASPGFYAPGGGYHAFAGRDGTRAFVTGCFGDAAQFTPDLRGVEAMFMSADDESNNNDDASAAATSGGGHNGADAAGGAKAPLRKESRGERKKRKEQVSELLLPLLPSFFGSGVFFFVFTHSV
jgi:predicted heme/steroid binding protein